MLTIRRHFTSAGSFAPTWTTRRHRRYFDAVPNPNRLLWAGVAAPVVFVVSFLVQGALRPGYDPLRHPVSALSLGPGGWVQMVMFSITGALIIAFAVGLRTAGIGRATPILTAIVGLGLVGAGFAACDPISGYPVGSPIPAPRTAHGIAHDLISTPVFTLLPAAMIVMARRFHRAGDRFWTWVCAVAAPAFFACFVLASIGFNQNPVLMPYGGLWQRLALIIGLGWLAALALRLRRPISAQAGPGRSAAD